jgi:hypothetical protein
MNYSESERGLCESLLQHGCPFVDGTPWVQSQSGEYFTSPDGIATAAFWLPCVLRGEETPLPGTCENCVFWHLDPNAPGQIPCKSSP